MKRCLMFALALLWCVGCASTATPSASAQFGAESNPTGNPIGGGVGYTKIINPKQATRVVADKAALLEALKSARAGDIVYVADAAAIDLTDTPGVEIPGGVTLAGGRGRVDSEGALILTNHKNLKAMFLAKGDKVRITGLRIEGPHLQLERYGKEADGYTPASIGLNSGGTQYFEVDNCDIQGFSWASVMIDSGSKNAYIHHNYIHDNRVFGMGRGIDHAAHGKETFSLIEANLFDNNRHDTNGIGYAGEGYEARYNLILEFPNMHHCMDMHGYQGGAGDWIKLHHNTIRATNVDSVRIRAVPRKQGEICNNWFYRPNEAQAVRQMISRKFVDKFVKLNVHDNCYGMTPPLGTTLPVARAKARVLSGRAPFTASFSDDGSIAPKGRKLVSYEWDFGDGTTAKGQKVAHAYAQPGRYGAVLVVRDGNGVPARGKTIFVTARPPVGCAILSFWVMDYYKGDLTGCVKEATIDGKVVWQDDVAGAEGDKRGWTHIVVDVTNLVRGKKEITLRMGIRCDNDAKQISEMFTFWDDITLFGTDLRVGDWEAPNQWSGPIIRGKWIGERTQFLIQRSGECAQCLRLPYGSAVVKGEGIHFQRTVKVDPQL